MTFNFEKFRDDLNHQFKNSLSGDEIQNLLGGVELYEKDSPISSGKRLIIERIIFDGIKELQGTNGVKKEKIKYCQKFELGGNLFIADNLKGKSSVFKLIKYALTGSQDSLKTDIKKWISRVFLNFRINDIGYTIYLNIDSNLIGILYKGTYENLDDLLDNNEHIIFEEKGIKKYEKSIQNFFFNQFSYYSLKWTQKSSQKDSTKLIEANASWKTYFKSILLESKDSYKLTWGDQGKKIFEILFGFELTHAINILKVKKDLIMHEKALLENKNKTEDDYYREKEKLNHQLSEIKNMLDIIKNDNKLLNLNRLRSQYKTINSEIQAQNREILKGETEIHNLKKLKYLKEEKLSEQLLEIKKLQKEVNKINIRINDIKEYLDIGQFFSNLDVKYCPCCDKSITKITTSSQTNTCILCNNEINNNEHIIDEESYWKKIGHLEETKSNLEEQITYIEKSSIDLQNDIIKTNKRLSDLNSDSLMDEISSKYEHISEIEKELNTELADYKNIESTKNKLISQKSVLEYKISLLSRRSNINYSKFNIKISLLIKAIEKLENARFVSSKKIIKQFTDLMLKEIHIFGLESITEIRINEKLDIQFQQNNQYLQFDEIAEGEQLRVKIAYYLSLIQLDIEYNYGKHTRLLIIDSPGKEEADSNYINGFSQVLKSIQERYGNKLQIIIGTAEREFSGILKNQVEIPAGEYVF